MNGILPVQMQEHIAGLLQGGATNPSLSGWLAASFDHADAGSMTLETGEEADFFTSRDGFEAEIHGEKTSQTLGLSWQDAALLLRAVYQEKKPIVNSVQTLPNLEATVTQPDFERLRPQMEAQSIDFGEFPQENGDVKITFSAQHYAAVQALLDALPEEELPLSQQETRQATPPPAENFHITDDHLGEGGAKTKYGWNLAAIRTLQQLKAENRPATPEEQEILSRYVGWGGLSQAFDPQNADWKKEYEELKDLLSESEYASARASTLNAHYTSPTVIRAMYEAVERMGFTSGNILEPACGVGNFFGLLPYGMTGSRLYGVELDSLTGRIARHLYPQANITVAGFETTDRRDFFDLAIGNVPFGNYQVSDKPYDKLRFPIHDYFFAKALDQVRPGGVVAFITSKGTMDKQNPNVRRYIARRAELLGAVRLPNNAFKANAGTEVTSDILFLQKRERPIDIEPDWVHLSVTEDGIPLNAYFAGASGNGAGPDGLG